MRPGTSLLLPGGGSSPYAAKAVHFATPSLLVRLPGLSTSDTPLATVSYWVRYPTDTDLGNADQPIGFAFSNGFSNYANDPSDIAVYLQDIAGANQYYVSSPAGVLSSGAWFNILESFDTNHAAGSRVAQMYVNDAAQSLVVNSDTGVAFNMPWATGLQSFVGYCDGVASSAGLAFELSDVMAWPGVLTDFSIEANRRLFIDGNGKPVNPSIAVAALGTPAVLMSGDATGFRTNQGSGGALQLATFVEIHGSNGAGPCTIVGPISGQTVFGVVDGLTNQDYSASFETTISVTGQIQQTDSANLSSINFEFYLSGGTLTNASTSPSD